MSCSSPFVFVAGIDYTAVNFTMGYSGNTTISAYTTPSVVTACVPCGYTCTQTTCGPECLCGAFKWCQCCTQVCRAWAIKWCDCVTVPGIELWPKLDIAASMNIPMSFEMLAGEAVGVTLDGPIEATSITIKSFNLSLNVNGQGFTIYVPITLTVEQMNGTFSVTIPLTSVSETYTAAGITYVIDMSFNLLTCLTPTNGMGWLNIQIVGSLTAEGLVGVPPYTTNFEFACPLISADED